MLALWLKILLETLSFNLLFFLCQNVARAFSSSPFSSSASREIICDSKRKGASRGVISAPWSDQDCPSGSCNSDQTTTPRATSEGISSTNKAKRLSKFAGVQFDIVKENWRVELTIPGLTTFREEFADETEAAKYYDQLVCFVLLVSHFRHSAWPSPIIALVRCASACSQTSRSISQPMPRSSPGAVWVRRAVSVKTYFVYPLLRSVVLYLFPKKKKLYFSQFF